MTIAQDENFIAQKVSIPELSLDRNAGCVISAGSAICANIVVSAGITTTLPITTVPYSPFMVPVSTSGVVATSTSAVLESTMTSVVESSSSSTHSVSTAPADTLVSPGATQGSTSGALRSPSNVLAAFVFAVASGLSCFVA